MLVYDGFMAQDASAQCSETRPKSGILTPESDASSRGESQVPSRKRKRDHAEIGNGLEDLLSERLIVKPHPSSIHDRPRSLKPIALLPRSEFPLSYLDRSKPPPSALPESRLYESHVKVLELEQRMGSGPMILVAQLDDNKTLYAVEYESRGLYVLFKLGPWVGLDKLCSVAIVSRVRSPSLKNDIPLGAVRNGTPVQDSFNSAESHKYNKKKRLAIEAIQSMVKRPPTSQSQNTEHTVHLEPLATTVILNSTVQGDQPDLDISMQTLQDEVLEQPRPEDILDGVRSQYFQTLYLSKVSTAYFAKGSLSRARAAFHLDYDSSLHMKDLIQFLDGLVLPTNTLDKKYKDGLQEFILKLHPGNASDIETDDKARQRKRNTKKVKLGKDGLYNTEDNYIRSWWDSHDDDAEIPGATREESTRSKISKLRVREILLQIILILETLALQKLTLPCLPDDRLASPSVTGDVSRDKTVQNKTKKSRDLSALVDVHLDRLCIWSLSEEEGRPIPKPGTTTKDSNLNTVGAKHAADILRGFCSEVIVPFFSARLPALCDTICRKLGGPRISSPARPSLKKSSGTSTAPSRSSAAVNKATPTESRRNLQRALTDEKVLSRSKPRRPSAAISLLRSATAPILPALKREGSETTLLSGTSQFHSQSEHARRKTAQKPKKLSRTDSDTSLGATTDRKSKKASIETELQNAISALKRPNRQLAGQTIVELAEKRAAAGASQSRKAKKPTRNAGFETVQTSGVQILATPRRNRLQNVGPEPDLPRCQAETELEPRFEPPSSVSRIPGSEQRLVQTIDYNPFFDNATPVSRDFNRFPVLSATPTRGYSQSKLEYGLTVVDSTPVRASIPYQGTSRTANQTMAIPDTPVRAARPSSEAMCATTTPRSRRGREIPQSPSPPGASRKSTINTFLRVPLEPYVENVSETPNQRQAIQCTPIKTRIELPKEVEKLHSPLNPLSFSSATSSYMEEMKSRLENKAIETTEDDGDIYNSLGWDVDDL